MNIFLKIFFFLLSSHSYALCEFKPKIQKIISLSGPTTTVLKELGLLKNRAVKGISVFNPVSDADYSGKVYPGGIFLSHQSLGEIDGSVVFFDESRELRKIFQTRTTLTAREVKTRNLGPDESVILTLEILGEFIQGCEKEVMGLKAKIFTLQESILKLLPEKRTMVFYLGDFLGGRSPEMVMVNDGVVKWLVSQQKIATYPTELAYVNWSAKILKSLPASTLHIAVKDSGRNGIQEIKKSPQRVTLVYPGALVTGLSQLRAFHFLFKAL